MTEPRAQPAALVEYSLVVPPLALTFELAADSVTRSRTCRVDDDTARALRAEQFRSPADVARVTQGIVPTSESVSFVLLLDATDRLGAGDRIAGQFGVQPELDVLSAMAQPKVHGPAGVQVLAGLGVGGGRGFAADETLPVLLFVWAERVQPVLLTALHVEEQAHLPSLYPYRARVTVELQVIESGNPFTSAETARQIASAGVAVYASARRAWPSIRPGGG